MTFVSVKYSQPTSLANTFSHMHGNSVLRPKQLQSFKQSNIYWHFLHNSFVYLIPISLTLKLKDCLLNFHGRTCYVSMISRGLKQSSRLLTSCFESGTGILNHYFPNLQDASRYRPFSSLICQSGRNWAAKIPRSSIRTFFLEILGT